MGVTAGTLTQQEIQDAILQSQQIEASASQALTSGQFVFFAAFDGTNNDRTDLPESRTTQPTSVAELETLVAQQNSANTNVTSRYYPGPGTDGSLVGSEALPWQVTKEVINTANTAYKNFTDEAVAWLDNNPNGSVTTMITGFSRGGAPASIFSQLLYEKGLVDPRNNNVLIQPGQVGVSAALLFEPVLTGVSGNMALPNASNVTVIRALDEFRMLFPAAEYNDPQMTIIDVYGNHGDVGGFYDRGLGACI